MRQQVEAELSMLPVQDDRHDMISVEAAALSLLHLVGGKPYCLTGNDQRKGIHLRREGLRFSLTCVGPCLCRGLAEIDKAGNYGQGAAGFSAPRAEIIRAAVDWCDGMERLDNRLRTALLDPAAFKPKKFERDARPIIDLGHTLCEQIIELSGWDSADHFVWVPSYQMSAPPPMSHKDARRLSALTSELAGLLRENPEVLQFMPCSYEEKDRFAEELEWGAELIEYQTRQKTGPEVPLFTFDEPPAPGRGRPVELYPRLISDQARGAYERLTGLRATRRFDPVTGRAGPFEEFLDSLFASMGIEASAARQVRQLMDKISTDA